MAPGTEHGIQAEIITALKSRELFDGLQMLICVKVLQGSYCYDLRDHVDLSGSQVLQVEGQLKQPALKVSSLQCLVFDSSVNFPRCLALSRVSPGSTTNSSLSPLGRSLFIILCVPIYKFPRIWADDVVGEASTVFAMFETEISMALGQMVG